MRRITKLLDGMCIGIEHTKTFKEIFPLFAYITQAVSQYCHKIRRRRNSVPPFLHRSAPALLLVPLAYKREQRYGSYAYPGMVCLHEIPCTLNIHISEFGASWTYHILHNDLAIHESGGGAFEGNASSVVCISGVGRGMLTRTIIKGPE